MAKTTVKITRHRIEQLDPPVDVFNIEVQREGGIWTESYGSEELVEAFTRGVKAGNPDFPEIPPIPREVTELPPQR